MKRFNSIDELRPYYNKETNTYIINDDVTFEFDLIIDANIYAYNIIARNIYARNIDAYDINARNIDANDIEANNLTANDIEANNLTANDINANDIDARHINAHYIVAYNINANDIKTINIKAHNIVANNIIASNIEYYAFCIAYKSFVCESVKGRRVNSIHTCLDGDIVIGKPKQTVTLELTEEQLDKIKQLLEETK